jgi:hypothetical protein
VIRNYVNEAEGGEDMQAKNHFKKQQKLGPFYRDVSSRAFS